MPRTGTFRICAAQLIWALKTANPALTRRELARFYPWGKRKGHRYRAWSQEARALIGPGKQLKPPPWPADGLPFE